MKNSIKNSMRASVLIAASALMFAACSEWTEYESLEIKTPSLDTQNPELYAQYLQNLKAYKAGTHKVVFTAFENTAYAPTKQSEQLTVVPDSVDYISLNTPDNLHPSIVSQMDKVREKGTKVIYNIDFAAYESEWVQMTKQDPSLTEEQALAYFTKRTQEQLALCDKYGYDGLTATYAGRALGSLTEAALAVYNARQKSFLDPILAWREAHSSKMLAFVGNAQFLLDENKPILAKCNYIVLMTDRVNNASDITVKAIAALTSGNVPSDRFIASTQTTRPDDKEELYGYFGSVDASGKKIRAIGATAEWIGESSDFVRSGILIRNVQYDYFNQVLLYRYTREAIGIMNPSPKN